MALPITNLEPDPERLTNGSLAGIFGVTMQT